MLVATFADLNFSFCGDVRLCLFLACPAVGKQLGGRGQPNPAQLSSAQKGSEGALRTFWL